MRSVIKQANRGGIEDIVTLFRGGEHATGSRLRAVEHDGMGRIVPEHDGGAATAWGRNGAKGGTVLFKNCRVYPMHGAAIGGKGGGVAVATGGL